jgi:hypothetical protein
MPWIIPLAAAAVSAYGSMSAADSAAQSQATANNTNIALQQQQLAQNLDIFHQTRGSTGSAILPEYLKGSEATLGQSAADTAAALFNYNGGAQGMLDSTGKMVAGYQPMIASGDQALGNIFNGQTAAQRQQSLAPVLAANKGVMAANTNAATSRAAAINSGLDQTLAGLRAGRAAAGFRGTSTFDTNRAIDATTGARMQAASELGQANVANAQLGVTNASATNALDESNLNLLLNNLNTPFTRAGMVSNFNALPVNTAAQTYSNAMAPLNYFKIGTGSAPQLNMPTVAPVPTNGQTAGAAIAGGAQSIGTYFAQQQQMQQLQQMYAQIYGNQPYTGQFGGSGNGVSGNLNLAAQTSDY